MTTARDIVRRSMQKIGALVKSEAPSADEAVDGLAALNGMISSWGNNPLSVFSRTLENFALNGSQSYTIGSGGNFNTTRPLNIISAYVREGITDYKINIVDDMRFAGFTTKSTEGIPNFLNYTNSYPLGVIRLYPVPSSAYTLYLLSEKPLSEFATLDTDVSLPAGWERALIYNLALELAPEYSQKPDAYLVKVASESLGLLRSRVASVRGMGDSSGDGIRNIYTGYWS